MISIAGHYLPCHNPAVAEYLERFVSPRDVVEFDSSGWIHSLHHLPARGNEPFPPIKVGTFRHPSGASRFSVGYFLVTTDELDEIYEDLYSDGGPLAVTLVMDNRDEEDDVATDSSIEAEVYCLPPRPLAQITGENGLYLLTVVDERYFWWFKSATVENGASWAAFYTNVGTALGITITAGTVDANYSTPSNRFKGVRQPIPPLLDAGAFYSGLRVVRHFDGSFVKAQTYTAAKTANDAEIAKIDPADGPYYPLAGGQFDNYYLIRNVPANVQVVFGRTDDGVYSLTPYTVDLSLLGLAISEFTDSYGQSFGFTDGVKSLTGDLVATYTGGGGSPSNVSTLADYAEQLAIDWYKWQLGELDQVFSGIVPWEPNGLVDCIEWTYRVGDCRTRVMRDRWYDHDWGQFRVNANAGAFSGMPDAPVELIDISGRTGSVSNVTAAQFLRTSVSGTSGATVITPDDASASLPGIVSTGTQTFAGNKTFDGEVLFNDYISQQLTDFLHIYDDGFSYRESANAYMSEGIEDVTNPVYSIAVRPAASGSSSKVIVINKDAVDAGQTCLIGNSAIVATEISAVYGHGFSIVPPGGGTYPYSGRMAGVTGTGGGGDTVTGGIITTLGTAITLDQGTW